MRAWKTLQKRTEGGDLHRRGEPASHHTQKTHLAFHPRILSGQPTDNTLLLGLGEGVSELHHDRRARLPLAALGGGGIHAGILPIQAQPVQTQGLDCPAFHSDSTWETCFARQMLTNCNGCGKERDN